MSEPILTQILPECEHPGVASYAARTHVMHVLDESCWCRPMLKDGQLHHHRDSPGVAALREDVETLRADLHAAGGEAVTND
jgi:hypothetical protein